MIESKNYIDVQNFAQLLNLGVLNKFLDIHLYVVYAICHTLLAMRFPESFPHYEVNFTERNI